MKRKQCVSDEIDRYVRKTKRIFEKKVGKRKKYNHKCLELLKQIIDKNPDMRFAQIISILGFEKDRFNEESVDTYHLIKQTNIYKNRNIQMKPLIKYTGGKYNEYKIIEKYLPDKINNYYEPFFGGGGLFFRLKENGKINGKSFASDLSEDLIDFYNCIGKPEFDCEVRKIGNAWNDIHMISHRFCEKYGTSFFDVIMGRKHIDTFINQNLKEDIDKTISETKSFSLIDFHNHSLNKNIYDNISSKTKKFIKKDIDENDDTIASKSIATAIHQGFYFTIRDMYNDWLYDKKNYTVFERSAQWYYIREFCFCGMFRFGKEGKFNVPYGGSVYNEKDFGQKINTLLSSSTKNLIDTCKFSVCDFETALSVDFQEDDFIFLDPPYDSTFSEYDKNTFTREDHKRLHDLLSNLHCKWLLAIGKTDFIKGLYGEYDTIEYDKTYSYQARGTYDNKRTTHLLIRNF